MDKVALIDLVRPYFFVGMDLGPGVQPVLEMLHVDVLERAMDDDAVVMWGVARIDSDDPRSPVFSPSAGGGPDELQGWEWHDVAVRFRLTAARRPAESLPVPDLADAEVRAALDAMGPTTGDVRSDAPTTKFRLELLFELVSVPLPGLVGGKLDGVLLVPDPAFPTVKLQLPNVVLVITQDGAADTEFDVDLASWGADTFDGLDESIATLIRMTPPYALISSGTFGFGLQRAVLDLSAEATPPDLLQKSGVGEDWKGLFLPEARVFVSTQAQAGTVFNAVARDLMIGFSPSFGLWGDVSLSLDFLGDRLKVDLRMYASDGSRHDPILEPWATPETEPQVDRFVAIVPRSAYVLFVDIEAGAAPFQITMLEGLPHTEPGDPDLPELTAFDDPGAIDLSILRRVRLSSDDQRVALRITSNNPTQTRRIVLDVYPDLRDPKDPMPPEVPGAKLLTDTPRVRIVRQEGDDRVVLAVDPPDATLTVNGAPVTVTDGLATVTVAPGEDHALRVSHTPITNPEMANLEVFFRYKDATELYAAAVPASGPAPRKLTDADFAPFVEQFSRAESSVFAYGYASIETSSDEAYNLALSQRRADAVANALAPRLGVDPTTIRRLAHGYHKDPDGGDPGLKERQLPVDNLSAKNAKASNRDAYREIEYRKVVVRMFARVEGPPDVTETTLHRDPMPVTPAEERPQEPAVTPPPQPSFLRHLGLAVRFERDLLPVVFEGTATVDFRTAHERGLEAFRNDLELVRAGTTDPDELQRLPQGDPNPQDGVVEIRATVTHDPATGRVTTTTVAKSAEADRDGLWSWGSIPAEDAAESELDTDGWRDLLGLTFVLAPLLESAAGDARNGEIAPLAVALATPVLVSKLGVAHVLRLTHYGIELTVAAGGGQGLQSAVLFDVEAAVWLDLSIAGFTIVRTRGNRPVLVRYKAVGFGLDVPSTGDTVFGPVFDASRGYTLDLADSGSLQVLPALGDAVGDIVQVLGAKIARTNPLNLEVELGLGADLGVVRVDRFGFRLPIDPLGDPTITAIGVALDIEGAITGAGYFKILETGFEGSLDVTLPSVGLRAAASMALRSVSDGDRSATGVLASIEAELPGGIPLGGTGLTIYGFLGQFAMHHARLENPGARIPSLDWFANIVHGDPTDVRGWGPSLDAWSLGVGLVAGTIEGGWVMALKGLLSIEVPGPRVLVFANASILKKRPPTRGAESGSVLAVVDVSPQRVLIGLRFEHHIRNVLDLVVPVEAGFYYSPPERFYLDVGTIARPATAKILSTFDATAYLMLHGDGIPDFPLGPLSGLALAAGFRTSMVWGDTDVGLYLRVAAGFDAGIGFSPFRFAGRVVLEGDLRLFIVTIGARGALQLTSDGSAARLDGEVCGRVSCWFFSVSGCVRFSVGSLVPAPVPPPLLADLLLQSRSPALVHGTGVDRGIDTILCRGTLDGSVPTVEVRVGDALEQRPVRVPIDAIPIAAMEAAPKLAAGATVDGQLQAGLPPGFADGWQKRGPNYLKYTLRSVELRLVTRHGAPVPIGTPPVTAGPRPYTWRHAPQAAGGDGLPVELALLDWKPVDADKALVMGPAMDNLVDSRWGRVCTPVAGAASVLWTFGAAELGPSPVGWALQGTPWPDDPDTVRSAPVPAGLRARETWRTGSFVDGLLGTTPAEVIGAVTACPAPVVDGETCVGKLLAAPFERPTSSLADLIAAGPLLDALLDLDHQASGGLRDVVRLSGNAFRDLTLLAYANDKMVISGLMQVRAYDAQGNLIAGTEHRWIPVSTGAEIPARWTDPTGPWWDDVVLARAYRDVLAAVRGNWAEYVVTVKIPGVAARVEIGVDRLEEAITNFGMSRPSWLLAAVEGVPDAENQRADADNQQQQDDADGLEDALGDRELALLLPDARYDVLVTYDAVIGARRGDLEADPEGDPNEIVELGSVSNVADARTFHTDAEAPRNLGPWMLAQFPAPGEPFHFTDDPVVLVFATDGVVEMFAAYDRELRAVARAASFRGSAETPEAPLTHLALATRFEKVGGVVLSPWETTVRRKLALAGCRDFDPDADRHGRTVLPFLLDPQTDYVLDLESLRPDGTVDRPPIVAPDVGHRPLHRTQFTTSAYPSRAALAEDVRTAQVLSRSVPDAAALQALADEVTDEQLDQALLACGLPVEARPDAPRLTVLWSADAVPAPIAVWIEAPEPLWRTRLEPTPEHDATGTWIERWLLQPTLWLEVDELVTTGPVLVFDGGDFVRRGTGTRSIVAPTIKALRDRYIAVFEPLALPPPPPPASVVARFVRDTSGTRTLAMLSPTARGRTVSLGLARRLHPLLDPDATDTPVVLCEVRLDRAPWEEETP